VEAECGRGAAIAGGLVPALLSTSSLSRDLRVFSRGRAMMSNQPDIRKLLAELKNTRGEAPRG
jgi:hypothetical protein